MTLLPWHAVVDSGCVVMLAGVLITKGVVLVFAESIVKQDALVLSTTLSTSLLDNVLVVKVFVAEGVPTLELLTRHWYIVLVPVFVATAVKVAAVFLHIPAGLVIVTAGVMFGLMVTGI